MRIKILDYIKAVAIILVIINHSLLDTWRFSIPYVFGVRMAVPLFVLVSGYTFAMSISKLEKPYSWWDIKYTHKRIVRFLIPVIVVWIVYVLKTKCGGGTLYEYAKTFVLADYGMGAYYPLVLAFLIMISPLVYYLLSRYRCGLLLVGICTLAYEIILYWCPIKISLYRVIGMRYLFLLALGMWTFFDPKRKIRNSILVISFILGIAYILLYKYQGNNTNIFPYKIWGNTSFGVFLYIYPIFYLLMKYGRRITLKNEMADKIITEVGQNTYYILMVQMVMFWGINTVYSWIQVPRSMQIFLNVIVACFGGIICGYIYEWICKQIKRICRKQMVYR